MINVRDILNEAIVKARIDFLTIQAVKKFKAYSPEHIEDDDEFGSPLYVFFNDIIEESVEDIMESVLIKKSDN